MLPGSFPEVADDEVAYAHLHGNPFIDDKTIIFDVASKKTGVMKKRGRKKQKRTEEPAQAI